MAAPDLIAPTFEIEYEGTAPDRVVAGFASVGLAGLTAVDYLVDTTGWPERGHVAMRGMPSITPFEDGRPRHHTRVFTADGGRTGALLGELFIPLVATVPFAREVVSWANGAGVEEVVVAAGIPIPHGPEQHRTFHVATDDPMADRFAGADIEPMTGGFLDGIKAEILELAMATDLSAGVLVTPVHSQYPDVTAALRLLEAIEGLYDLGVDTKPLREYAEAEQRYYAELSETLETAHERDHPADRMYM